MLVSRFVVGGGADASGTVRVERDGTWLATKELKGEARQEAAKASERTTGKVEKVTGAIKNRVGAAIGNEQMQAEGKARELKGDARQRANR